MPLNCSTFVTQKEQLKCQAARAIEQHAMEYVTKVYGLVDNVRNPLNKTKYKDVYEKVGKEMGDDLNKMYREIDAWLQQNGFMK